MSTSGDKEIIAIAAGADLSAFQYKIVAVDGTLAATNAVALGVLLNKPKSGESASVAYSGHMKAYVGGGFCRGGRAAGSYYQRLPHHQCHIDQRYRR